MRTLCEHQHQQCFEARPVVVQTRKQPLHRFHQRGIVPGTLEYAPRGSGIERRGGDGDLKTQSAARSNRQLRTQRLTEGVNGHDAQPCRCCQQVPTSQAITTQRRLRVVCFKRALSAAFAAAFCRAVQGLQYTLAHLRRRLAGKGNGQDFLGLMGCGQQGQQSAGQHGGLA